MIDVGSHVSENLREVRPLWQGQIARRFAPGQKFGGAGKGAPPTTIAEDDHAAWRISGSSSASAGTNSGAMRSDRSTHPMPPRSVQPVAGKANHFGRQLSTFPRPLLPADRQHVAQGKTVSVRLAPGGRRL